MNNSKWCLRSCLIKCKKSETVWKVEMIQMSWTYQQTPKPLSTPPPHHHPPTSILFKINWEMEILSKWDISRPNQISIIHIEAIFDPPRWSYIKIYNDFFFFSEQFSSFSFSVALSINRNSRGRGGASTFCSVALLYISRPLSPKAGENIRGLISNKLGIIQSNILEAIKQTEFTISISEKFVNTSWKIL